MVPKEEHIPNNQKLIEGDTSTTNCVTKKLGGVKMSPKKVAHYVRVYAALSDHYLPLGGESHSQAKWRKEDRCVFMGLEPNGIFQQTLVKN